MDWKQGDAFTSGTGILRIEGSTTVPAGQEIKKEFDLGEYYKKDLDFQSIRGRIINASLLVEEKISMILNKVFVKKDQKLNTLFQSIVLDREFFTFMAKWKVLRDLFHNFTVFKDKNYSDLLNNIKEVIDIRDMFAHGTNTHLEDKAIVIDYFKEKPRREEITKEFLEEFDKKIKSVYQELDSVYIFLL